MSEGQNEKTFGRILGGRFLVGAFVWAHLGEVVFGVRERTLTKSWTHLVFSVKAVKAFSSWESTDMSSLTTSPGQ